MKTGRCDPPRWRGILAWPIRRLSAAITRLAAQGYVLQSRDAADKRAIELRLSRKGAAAMQASSVLDTPRVKRMLQQLNAAERKRALDGLALLARARLRASARRQIDGHEMDYSGSPAR